MKISESSTLPAVAPTSANAAGMPQIKPGFQPQPAIIVHTQTQATLDSPASAMDVLRKEVAKISDQEDMTDYGTLTFTDAAESLPPPQEVKVDVEEVAVEEEEGINLPEIAPLSSVMEQLSILTKQETLLTMKSDELVGILRNLNIKLSEISTDINCQSRNQRLEFAFQNSSFESFPIFKKGVKHSRQSQDFVKIVVTTFRKGRSQFINDYAVDSYDGSHMKTQEQIVESEKKFRELLKDQLYSLIGLEPCLLFESTSGKWAIMLK